jgi:alpha-soluble NSF attachment protein
LKYNAKGYFVCAIFCLLAMGDSVAGRMKIDAFGAVDFSFLDSREGKLCDQLVEAVDNSDGDAMATACFEFDRVSKLDAWKTTILVSIKRGIVDNNGDDDDVDLS